MQIKNPGFTHSVLAALVIGGTACGDTALPAGPDFASGAPRFAVNVDASGTGFVGKGDVQTFFGWNNPALQNAAKNGQIEFRVRSVTEWSCSKENPGGGPDIEVEHTTTIRNATTITGRENSEGLNGPWTGFILLAGDAVTQGPEVGQCPNAASGFTYDDNATVTEGGLQIRQTTGTTTPTGKVSGTWYNFPG